MDFPKSKDDLKQDTEKCLRGLLEVGTIDYTLYSYICDEFDSCINMAFELGNQEGVKKNDYSCHPWFHRYSWFLFPCHRWTFLGCLLGIGCARCSNHPLELEACLGRLGDL